VRFGGGLGRALLINQLVRLVERSQLREQRLDAALDVVPDAPGLLEARADGIADAATGSSTETRLGQATPAAAPCRGS
jgi:hypothetical protein